MSKRYSLPFSAIFWMVIGAFTYLLVQRWFDLYTCTDNTDELLFSGRSSRVQRLEDLKVPAVPKTRVLRHDGIEFKTLTDFCTWTVPLDCVTMKTHGGPMPIYIHRPADDYSSRLISQTGTKHQDNLQAIFSEFDEYPDAGFIDVGSHVGLFSLQAAKRGRRVISVDPLVENIQRLCKSVQRNGLTSNMTIVLNAISDERRVVTVLKKVNNVGETRIRTDSKPSDTRSACDVPVPTYSVLLDDLLPFVTFRTAFLKVDVEQHEFHVINGGQNFLHRIHVPLILMEWYHVKKSATAQPLIKLMDTLKYIPYSPSTKRVALKPGDYLRWPFDVLWVKQKS